MKASIWSWLLPALVATACGCSRKTEHRSHEAEPIGTFRRAVEAADSAAAKSGRRAAAIDSMAADDR